VPGAYLPISDGTALCNVISGIYDQVTVGAIADREVVPDMDFYIDCIKHSTEEYLQLSQIKVAEPEAQVVSSKTAAKAKPVQAKKAVKPEKPLPIAAKVLEKPQKARPERDKSLPPPEMPQAAAPEQVA
jgi:diacylglycerol O-acyltransferase / wax synthase